jgi:hypothetical protein
MFDGPKKILLADITIRPLALTPSNNPNSRRAQASMGPNGGQTEVVSLAEAMIRMGAVSSYAMAKRVISLGAVRVDGTCAMNTEQRILYGFTTIAIPQEMLDTIRRCEAEDAAKRNPAMITDGPSEIHPPSADAAIGTEALPIIIPAEEPESHLVEGLGSIDFLFNLEMSTPKAPTTTREFTIPLKPQPIPSADAPVFRVRDGQPPTPTMPDAQMASVRHASDMAPLPVASEPPLAPWIPPAPLPVTVDPFFHMEAAKPKAPATERGDVAPPEPCPPVAPSPSSPPESVFPEPELELELDDTPEWEEKSQISLIFEPSVEDPDLVIFRVDQDKSVRHTRFNYNSRGAEPEFTMPTVIRDPDPVPTPIPTGFDGDNTQRNVRFSFGDTSGDAMIRKDQIRLPGPPATSAGFDDERTVVSPPDRVPRTFADLTKNP